MQMQDLQLDEHKNKEMLRIPSYYLKYFDTYIDDNNNEIVVLT